MTPSDTLIAAARPLRRDAAQNREKLIDAATRVFAARGLDATVEEVAREAGVGMGTLYRRFAHKQALIDELVGGVRRMLLDLAIEARERDDGSGLEQLLVATGLLQAEQPGCLAQLWSHSDAELGALRRYRRILVDLLTVAQEAGRVRADVTNTDVTMILWSMREVVQTTKQTSPDAWRRHLELLIAGLRPPAGAFAAPLREKPLTESQARRITAAARPG